MKTTVKLFQVGRSRPGLGNGLFASSSFARGEFIVEYSGIHIPTPYADTLKTRYLFELDEKWTVDGNSRDNVARYINHSCEPNCEADIHDGHILIFARRAIDEGEELTLDYGEEYFDEFIRPVGCKCVRCTQGATAVRA